MKKLLFLAFLLVNVAYGQFAPTSSKTAFKNGIGLGSKDSTAFSANDSIVVTIDRQGRLLWRGLGVNAPWRIGTDKNYVDSTNALRVRYTDTSSMLAPFVQYSDTASMLSNRLKISDTAAMLAPFVQYSDTASMLVPFVQYSDTAYMLTPYYRTATATSALATKLNISDTSTMLSNYRRTSTLIENSDLRNNSITINGSATALGGSVSVGTVTSVSATGGTGISVTGSPITGSGTLTITNTAPDQTVSLTSGTGISVTGTYPNFTVTNTSPSSGGTVTSIATTGPITGGTITGSGTIGITQATTSTDGYLSSIDWNTFNNKQPAGSYLTGNQTITLSGDVSGSGATAITTTIGAGKVTNTMLAGSIDYAKMNAATVPTWNQNTTGTAANATTWNNETYGGIYTTGTQGYFLVYNTTNSRWEASNIANSQIALGLGLYAYRSSGLAELSGATFTGALSGTSLSMSGAGSFGGSQIGSAVLSVRGNTSTAGRYYVWDATVSTAPSILNTSNNITFYTNTDGLAGTIFSDGKWGILTATNNGTDALQVAGSGLFTGGVVRVVGNGIDAFFTATTTAGGTGAFIKTSNADRTYYTGISGADSDGWVVYDETANAVRLLISSTGEATFSSSVTTGDYIIIPNNKALFWNSISSDYIYGNSGTVTIGTANTDRVSINSTKVQINQTTASTSTTTGALVVSGGVGVGGAIYAGGNITAPAPNYSSGGYELMARNATSGRFETVTTTLLSSSYTPTYISATNVSSYTINSCLYTQTGNSITVTGELKIVPSASATLTTFEMSLPLATGTSTASVFNGTGTADESGFSFRPVTIEKGTGSDMKFSFTSNAALEQNRIKFTFTYQYVAP